MIGLSGIAGSGLPGLSATVGYRLVDATFSKQFEAFKKSAAVQREIAHAREAVAKLDSVEDLTKDYRLFRLVLSAFGLESQINAQALIKKVIAEDWRDPKSTANKLVDARFRELARTLDVAASGLSKLKSEGVLNGIIDRYLTAEFEKKAGETNPAVRLALYFKRKAPEASNWFQVLGDKPLYDVVRTALNLPAAGSQTSIDKQAQILEKRIGLANLKDPAFLERFISRFLVNYDQSNATTATSVAALIQPLTVSSGGGISLGLSTILELASRR